MSRRQRSPLDLTVPEEDGQPRFWCLACYQFRPHGHEHRTLEERTSAWLAALARRAGRDGEIRRRRAAGEKLRVLAGEYGLTTQRVSQIARHP